METTHIGDKLSAKCNQWVNGLKKYFFHLLLFRTSNAKIYESFFQMVQAIQVLRFHLLELEKVSRTRYLYERFKCAHITYYGDNDDRWIVFSTFTVTPTINHSVCEQRISFALTISEFFFELRILLMILWSAQCAWDEFLPY